MKLKIDWLNHSLEFIVVLIGILIAFQLNKCSENRTQSDLIDNHLEYISEECRTNENMLNVSISQISEQIKYCDSLLTEITSNKNPTAIRLFSTKLLDLRNEEMNSNAFEVLTQSGDIRFIKDYQKKRKIISMYDSFSRINQINQSNQKLYDNHFYPYIKENFDLVNWTRIATVSEKEAQVYSAKEYANTISTYRFLLVAKQNTYEDIRRIIKSYLEES